MPVQFGNNSEKFCNVFMQTVALAALFYKDVIYSA